MNVKTVIYEPGRKAAYQAPPSMGFSRQEYWSGVPLPKIILLFFFQSSGLSLATARTLWIWYSPAEIIACASSLLFTQPLVACYWPSLRLLATCVDWSSDYCLLQDPHKVSPFALWGYHPVTHPLLGLSDTISLYFSFVTGDPTLRAFLGPSGL